jgi:fructose-bisphosphate aldolase, class II
MYVSMKSILDKANKENYAVIAANVINFETARAAITAAEEENSPLIVNNAHGHTMNYIRGEYIASIVRMMAEKSKVPVALNLDHGRDLAMVARAVQWRFSSVMIDASLYPLEENIRRTKEVVNVAHPLGITVEAEIGHVGQGSDYVEKDLTKLYTDPEEAKYFVEQTGVDALAVAVGTAHGQYKGTPKIDFDRLKLLKDTLKMPLVLHGGSGTGDENLRKAVECGINKVNIFTDSMVANTGAILKKLNENPEANFMELLTAGENAMKETLKYYIRLFGSSKKA